MMAGLRGLRKIPSLGSIVARRRKRIKYTDFTASHPVAVPVAVTGTKIKDRI